MICIHIVYSTPLIRTEILIFHIGGITVTLSWKLQHELESSAVANYYVSVIPLASLNRRSRNATLRLSYNTMYAVNIVASICQRNVSNSRVTVKVSVPRWIISGLKVISGAFGMFVYYNIYSKYVINLG